MKILKIWSMMMLIAMSLPFMIACGSDDNDEKIQKKSEVELFCINAKIDFNKYELQKVYFNNQLTSKNGYYGFAGYEKGSDRFHFWICKYNDLGYFYDIIEYYNEIVPRNFTEVGLSLKIGSSPLKVKEYDIAKDYGEFLQLYFSYTSGEKDYLDRKLIFVLRQGERISTFNLYSILCTTASENDFDFYLYEWCDNSVAVTINSTDNATICDAGGIRTYLYDNIEEFMKNYTIIEIYSYYSCIAFRKTDKGDQVETIVKCFEGIDKSITTSFDAKSTATITSEIISSNFSNCIFRLIFTEYSGEKKYLKFRVDKLGNEIELIEN